MDTGGNLGGREERRWRDGRRERSEGVQWEGREQQRVGGKGGDTGGRKGEKK